MRQALGMSMMAGLVACGGGGGDGGGSTTSTGTTISGGGVKGPMANATVTVYAFDASQPGFRGSAVGSGSTDSSAAITGLSLPFPLNPPYIMEFTANAGTTDITTGQAPVITELRTVITQALLDKGEQIYATPLTTMAVDIAVQNAQDTNGTPGIQADEFEAALPLAASQVASTVGFGLDSSVDIFDTPPLVDDTTDTTEEQGEVAAYRSAVEALTAVAYQMQQQSAGDSDTVLAELAADLADGSIDGQVNGKPSAVFTSTTLDVLEQDPASLPIPNSDDGSGNPVTVGEVEAILVSETATTGTSTDTSDLASGDASADPVPAETSPDIDGDGVLNAEDAFPNDSGESVDTDGDGIGNNTDTDDDGDGVADGSDAFPLDPAEQLDTDGDGIGNNADTDDDNDGVADASDDFPLDPARQNKSDVDNDGWPAGQDADDNDPAVPGTAFVDTDGDGIGDGTDTDDDNDGVADGSDAFPLDPSEQLDTDGDTIGNNADSDDDGDGVADVNDAFPLDATESQDLDGDGVGDNGDTDSDGDGYDNATEGAPATDTDSDGIPDYLDFDSDDDGILDKNEVDDAARRAVDTPNVAPVADAAAVSTDEDTTLNNNLTATDADAGDTLTYALVGAAGNGTVTVNTDGSFSYVPDAEFSGTDSFTFQATDNNGAASNVATVSITVNSINDAPTIDTASGAVNVNENSSVVLTLTASDVEGDTLGWSISGGPDAVLFSIDSATGALAFLAAPDFEAPADANSDNIYEVAVVVSDGTDSSAAFTVTATVQDVVEFAVIGFSNSSSASFAENGSGTVTTVSATGGIGSMSYAITGGADAGAFSIDPASGALGFVAAPDFEAPTDSDTNNSYLVDVTATDADGNAGTQSLTVTVTNVAESATLSFTNPASASVDEETSGVVLTVNATGGIGTTTYSLGGTDAAAFTLDSNTGDLSFVTTPNFESPNDAGGDNVYDVSVTATDSDGNTASQGITVTVNDVIETVALNFTSPSAVSVAENTTAVTTVTVDNGIGTVTYSFGGGVDDSAFSLDTATGELSFLAAPDYENPTDAGADNVYDVSITATDADNNTNTQAIVVTVTDVTNETAGPAVWDNFNWDDGSTWQ